MPTSYFTIVLGHTTNEILESCNQNGFVLCFADGFVDIIRDLHLDVDPRSFRKIWNKKKKILKNKYNGRLLRVCFKEVAPFGFDDDGAELITELLQDLVEGVNTENIKVFVDKCAANNERIDVAYCGCDKLQYEVNKKKDIYKLLKLPLEYKATVSKKRQSRIVKGKAQVINHVSKSMEERQITALLMPGAVFSNYHFIPMIVRTSTANEGSGSRLYMGPEQILGKLRGDKVVVDTSSHAFKDLTRF